MSKYTTEVRFICEQSAGLDESVGYADVDDVLEASYDKIFKVDKIPIFDAEYGKELYKKILGHYYTREIGFETVGLWKMKLNQRMIEIMPYYNKLYESELIEFDPLHNIDKTITDAEIGSKNTSDVADRSRNGSTHDTKAGNTNTILRHERTTTRGNDTATNVINSDGESWNLFSDTPEGGITGIKNASSGNSVGNNAYLTNATHVIETPNGQTVTNTFGNVSEKYNANGDNVDSVTDATVADGQVSIAEHDTSAGSEGTSKQGEHHVIGKEGTESYSELLKKYRDTFMNIDVKIINELEDLFMSLW